MKYLLIVWLVILCAGCQPKALLSEQELIGIWQVSPSMASGWDDAYQFFDSGEFIFNTSQMNCEERNRSFAGTWKLTDTHLELTIRQRVVLEGGQLVESVICATAYEIEGGELKTYGLEKSEIKSLSISAITPDEGNMNRDKITLENKPFWKISDDPSSY
jgi:hypothetical protein